MDFIMSPDKNLELREAVRCRIRQIGWHRSAHVETLEIHAPQLTWLRGEWPLEKQVSTTNRWFSST